MKNIKFNRYIACLLSSTLFSCCSVVGMEKKSYLDMDYTFAFKGLNDTEEFEDCRNSIPLNKLAISKSKFIQNKTSVKLNGDTLMAWGHNGAIYKVNDKRVFKLTYSSNDMNQDYAASKLLLSIRKNNKDFAGNLSKNLLNIYDTQTWKYSSKKNENQKLNETDFNVLICMDYINGINFSKFLSNLKGGYFCDFDIVLNWMSTICKVLLLLKNNGLIYGDLHNDNIMLYKENNEIIPVLVDYGHAYTKESLKSTQSVFSLDEIESTAIENVESILKEFYENENVTNNGKIQIDDLESLKKCKTFEELVNKMEELIEKCK